MIDIVYIFEGKTQYSNDRNLEYDHSLSIHKTFSGAEEALEFEKNTLIDSNWTVKYNNKFDVHGKISIECILLDEFLVERTLTVNQWLVRD
jgi:hypothetical protein